MSQDPTGFNWAHRRQKDPQGRACGYSIDAICDHEGCKESIDRGLAFVCGGSHGGGDHGCGLYFCYSHLAYVTARGECSPQLCPTCQDTFEKG